MHALNTPTAYARLFATEVPGCDVHRFYFDRTYGVGPDGEGLILDCPEAPRLTLADLQELHGGNFDQAPGDPEDLGYISEPDAAYRARVAAFEQLDAEREYDLEQAELARHNREVRGWAAC